MKANSVPEGTTRHIVGDIERFDQKDEMFKRITWDPTVRHILERFRDPVVSRERRPGYDFEDRAFHNAAWALAATFGSEDIKDEQRLYSWSNARVELRRQSGKLAFAVADPAKMTDVVNKAARFFGASLSGVCLVDENWVYSHSYTPSSGNHRPIEIPEDYRYAIVMAFEMDYETMKYSPSYLGEAVTGLGYSRMAFTTYSVANYIRNLGYRALPMGNDTACSIPLAIDAGLGELSRGGFLITEEFGPRVRLSKVFTDLPLTPDTPIEFGAWDFCLRCQKCAQYCPGQAIMYGEPTIETHGISNRKGLLRWPIDAEKCYNFWAVNGVSCSSCLRVCPFNKPSNQLHRLARWSVRNARWLDPFLLRMDDLLGYGRRRRSEPSWK